MCGNSNLHAAADDSRRWRLGLRRAPVHSVQRFHRCGQRVGARVRAVRCTHRAPRLRPAGSAAAAAMRQAGSPAFTAMGDAASQAAATHSAAGCHAGASTDGSPRATVSKPQEPVETAPHKHASATMSPRAPHRTCNRLSHTPGRAWPGTRILRSRLRGARTRTGAGRRRTSGARRRACRSPRLRCPTTPASHSTATHSNYWFCTRTSQQSGDMSSPLQGACASQSRPPRQLQGRARAWPRPHLLHASRGAPGCKAPRKPHR